jgi:hypothetical protein
MTTTKIKEQIRQYSPSTNIERDNDKLFQYITTPNTEAAYRKIVNGYRTGVRSFNIVGAYGTGKSSFLVAFEQTLTGKGNFFKKNKNHFNSLNAFEFVRIVGTFDSLIETFARKFGVPVSNSLKADEVIKAISKSAGQIQKSGKGIVILVDEFGKFLEYAAKHNPDKELYFIQQLAEFANDINKETLLLTTLHQDFNGYSRTLTKSQQNEWDKVKGRLQEVPFNEPVEQLLFLGAERIANIGLKKKVENFDMLFIVIEKSKLLPISDYNTKLFAKKLLPFDLIAASIITAALQKYGQNERSLFAFIESNDAMGIRAFDTTKAPYYNLAAVYDYLAFNFYGYLHTTDNPDKSQWYAMRSAIERCDGLLEEKAAEGMKLVKTIGLLNLFGATTGKLNATFLEQYGRYSLGITNCKKVIDALQHNKIIRWVNFNQKFVLFEGTDVDIDLAISEAGDLIETVSNVVNHLNKYFDGGFIPAKAVFYETGTPRFFQFLLSEKPEINKIPEGEVDGFINLIFSDFVREEDLQTQLATCNEAILFCLFRNTLDISKEIFNIEKVNKAIENHRDDTVVVRVLNEVRESHLKLLNHYVVGSLYSNNANVVWYFAGQRIANISDRKSLNKRLSLICNQVYSKTPIYKNELLNKTNYSGVISKSRKELIKRLLEQAHLENIGYLPSEFPPTKSIYLTLLKDTGIHRSNKDYYIIGEPQTASLTPLWEASVNFLESAKYGKRSINEFCEILLSKPYKCKQGLVDFWIPVFLIIKKDDFALFHEGIFIPNLTEDTLDLVIKNPKEYEIKAFQVGGIRLDLFNSYRQLINKNNTTELKVTTFIDTIKPFLSFYKGLTFYAQKTNSVSNNAKKLRESIVTSVDPETTFFEKFPEALGYSIHSLQKNKEEMQGYILHLQDAIRQLRTVYFDLLDRFELLIQNEVVGKKVPFETYKGALEKRFSGIKEHLLSPTQKRIISQFLSPIDDRNSWLNAVSQACVDKKLEQFTDSDEKNLRDKFVFYLNQLDNLCELSKSNIDFSNEDVIKLEITSFVENMQERIIRMPKTKTVESIRMSEYINSKLSSDKQLNIVTLVNLLKEQLKNE